MDSQLQSLLIQIEDSLPRTGSIEAAVSDVRGRLESSYQIRLPEEIWQRARQEIEKRYQAQIQILHSVHHPARWRQNCWYRGPKPGDRHWPALRSYLENVKKWSKEDLASLDEASSEVVSLLGNPSQDRFSIRGLVVGFVQSGKTANMAAVIAKAADAGYNCIIVLAGLTNALRHQTQSRLYNDLVLRHPLLWEVLTPAEPQADFAWPRPGGFSIPVDRTMLLVLKKNRAPLERLKYVLRHTLPVVLRRIKCLFIDDECDQASVNAAGNDGDMTAINCRIRRILRLFPSVSYVGYTATPFANVLIDPYVQNQDGGQTLDDLYPRDFITSLPAPPHYFGTSRLFGRTPVDPARPEPEEEGLDMIRVIPVEDELNLQPRNRSARDTFSPVMPDSLEQAILYFLAACAARRIRGQSEQHMTMLVHTSPLITLHEAVADLIRRWIGERRNQPISSQTGLVERLVSIWEAEQKRVPSEMMNLERIEPERILEEIPRVLESIEVVIENSQSPERIAYGDRPRTYIVVGGTVLSRGLTLEGLMVSYFLRSANQYDTLLQMGRWFGYRPGYEDLPRIWTSEDLILKFRALAGIEDEVRAEIERYRIQQLTPMDLAVRIRTIPGMAITAANKMRAAREVGVSFWGTHRQTFRFQHRDAGLLLSNWDAAAKLVSDCEMHGRRQPGVTSRVWHDVPRNLVYEFLNRYQPHPTHADLGDVLREFVQQSDDVRLDFWNVGLVEPEDGSCSELELGSAGKVRMVRRSRLRGDDSVADIKALMSRRDILLDCPPESMPYGHPGGADDWEELKSFRRRVVGDRPLILLYAIDRNSRPVTESTTRIPLDAVKDVIGYGIVFPGSSFEGGKVVSVQLRPEWIEDLEAAEEEEREVAREAGLD